MLGKKFNIHHGIQELALPTSSCSSEFLASREFRILSFCCFSRLPIPFPSATGRNCRNDMIQFVHKISLLRQPDKSKPLRYKNLSMFARMLGNFSNFPPLAVADEAMPATLSRSSFLDFLGRSALVPVMGKDFAASCIRLHTRYIGELLDDYTKRNS